MQISCLNNTEKIADVKDRFASLKYEQMVGDKYFIQTCFSKQFDSYPPREMLRDMYLMIKLNCN